ncbi:UNVERIFIED_CONTAM: hypothetical protein PYX00_002587 [Menopon gallinae]|uniref:Lipocalin/cytosolic fatty-acid binding domain-containing protein n=1 Tax=Menopon gallinae TaxID=328185 RepID=A0AAW2IIV9_9NEOP
MLAIGLSVLLANFMMSDSFENHSFCPDYRPQRTLDVDQLMGIWYAIEIFEHDREGVPTTLRSCPTVHLGRESRSDLRLVWSESAFTFYYHIRLNDPASPGFWLSSGPYNGTTVEDDYSTRFSGTIQVMKAVGNHVVLTFCKSEHNSKVFSVLLSRERWLSKLEIRGVINMLQRRGLESKSIKHACSGVAGLFRNFFVHVVLASIFIYLL